MFVTKNNHRVGLRVKLNPESRFLGQSNGAAYGLTEALDSYDGWCSVRWYDSRNNKRGQNYYRISLNIDNSWGEGNKVYDLIMDNKNQQFEFEF